MAETPIDLARLEKALHEAYGLLEDERALKAAQESGSLGAQSDSLRERILDCLVAAAKLRDTERSAKPSPRELIFRLIERAIEREKQT